MIEQSVLVDMVGLSNEETAALEQIAQVHGWPPQAVQRAFRDWQKLVREIPTYDGMIEEYLNELYARDMLEIALKHCSGPFRRKLRRLIAEPDQVYRAATLDDGGRGLGAICRVPSGLVVATPTYWPAF